MVRGNWQRRVEKAEARRKEGKQRKQGKENRRAYKAWVQDLLALLDGNESLKRRRHSRQHHHQHDSNDSCSNGRDSMSTIVVHLWTESRPSKSPPLLDQEEEEASLNSPSNKHQRRGRSGSIGSNKYETSGSGRKGRGRSNSQPLSESPVGKQKKHPRSKELSHGGESAAKAAAEDAAELPLLCKSHFFSGKCSFRGGGGSGKKGKHHNGCRYYHHSPSSQYKTLSEIVAPKKNKRSYSSSSKSESAIDQQELALSRAAAASSITATENLNNGDSHPDAMEMLYYMKVEEPTTPAAILADGEIPEKEDRKQSSLWSDAIVEAFSSNEINPSSIVYAAVNHVLVFDRYQEGVLISADTNLLSTLNAVSGGETLVSFSSSSRKGRSSSLPSGCEDPATATTMAGDVAMNLPGTVLEHVLMFCPSITAVSAVTQVCRAWHRETGKSSPNLWRHLLERHGWSLPQETDTASADGTANDSRNNLITYDERFRADFISHYLAMRDITAIKTALAAITTRKLAEEKEMAYQDFSVRQHAPCYPNACVGVQIWSQTQMLVGYENDCSLRLFETTTKAGSNEKCCRELVYQIVDPYRNTKKRSCRLLSMELDDDLIGCLCHVMKNGSEAYILVVLDRNEFLESDSGELGGCADQTNQNVIDCGEAVLNYLLSYDEADHRLLELVDYLNDGGELENVKVSVSRTMAACGSGRFFFEASISIPSWDEVEGDTIDRRLFLFSAHDGAIVWMGERPPLVRGLRRIQKEMSLAYLRHSPPGSSLSTCCLVIGSSTSPIMVGEVLPTGDVQIPHLVESSWSFLSDILVQGQHQELQNPLYLQNHRVLFVTRTDIVAADTFLHLVDDGAATERRTVVSFYPRSETGGNPSSSSYSTLVLPGNLEAIRMASFRDQHIILLCRHRIKGGGAEADDDVQVCVSVYAIIIHIRSRLETNRICLIENVSENLTEIPHFAHANDGAVGVALSWKGVVMTGQDVRYCGESRQHTVPEDVNATLKSTKKKKKKRGAMRGIKKDRVPR